MAISISDRVKNINESLTLKLNARAVELTEQGKKVYNLTAGQLPFRPSPLFIDQLRNELNFIKSFQYSPVPGFLELRKKIQSYLLSSRQINEKDLEVELDCIIGNGGKSVLTSIFACLLNPGDEVIIFSPYWVSYPEMINTFEATPVVVSASSYTSYVPSIDELKKKITAKTKAIIINSPNNPTGIHYSDEWMQQFASLLEDYPQLMVISDEIYYGLCYFDPGPTYFYQKNQKLLERTIIVDGISKILASTGLRIGYAMAPKSFIKTLSSYQGQTASGASSLVQRALLSLDFDEIDTYLLPIKKHLRDNANALREALDQAQLSVAWYQSVSAFYYLLDFTNTPAFKRYQKGPDDQADYSMKICEDLLDEYGLALVPGVAFGCPNSARMSLVLERSPFDEALELLMKFLL